MPFGPSFMTPFGASSGIQPPISGNLDSLFTYSPVSNRLVPSGIEANDGNLYIGDEASSAIKAVVLARKDAVTADWAQLRLDISTDLQRVRLTRFDSAGETSALEVAKEQLYFAKAGADLLPLIAPRRKTEVFWTLVGVTLPANTDVNLVNWLKGLAAPQYGTLAPFFNTATDKLNAFDDDSTMTFKLSIAGSWSGGSSVRSIELDFAGTNGNKLVESRDAAVTSDNLTLATFFSIDKGGNIVTNGTTVNIRSNGGAFNVASVLLVAEQRTAQATISAV